MGLSLNVALVIILLLIMFSPGIIMTIFSKIEELLVAFRFWKKSEKRKGKVNQFLAGYRETVCFLKIIKLIVVTMVCTFLQRFSIFVLTYVVYRGLGLNGFAMIDVVLLQASVYIAVDMFPIPGAQGITEAIYKKYLEIFSWTISDRFYVYYKGNQFLLYYDSQLWSVGNRISEEQ